MTDDLVKKMVNGLLPDGTLIRACEATFGHLEKQEDRIKKLETALAKIAQHDMQAIAMDALRPGDRIRKALDAE